MDEELVKGLALRELLLLKLLLLELLSLELLSLRLLLLLLDEVTRLKAVLVLVEAVVKPEVGDGGSDGGGRKRRD